MASDDTEALDQVAEAVDRSDLTDEDVEELRALLEKLDDEEWADQKRHRVGTVSVTAPSRRFDRPDPPSPRAPRSSRYT